MSYRNHPPTRSSPHRGIPRTPSSHFSAKGAVSRRRLEQGSLACASPPRMSSGRRLLVNAVAILLNVLSMPTLVEFSRAGDPHTSRSRSHHERQGSRRWLRRKVSQPAVVEHGPQALILPTGASAAPGVRACHPSDGHSVAGRFGVALPILERASVFFPDVLTALTASQVGWVGDDHAVPGLLPQVLSDRDGCAKRAGWSAARAGLAVVWSSSASRSESGRAALPIVMRAIAPGNPRFRSISDCRSPRMGLRCPAIIASEEAPRPEGLPMACR